MKDVEHVVQQRQDEDTGERPDQDRQARDGLKVLLPPTTRKTSGAYTAVSSATGAPTAIATVHADRAACARARGDSAAARLNAGSIAGIDAADQDGRQDIQRAVRRRVLANRPAQRHVRAAAQHQQELPVGVIVRILVSERTVNGRAA